MPYIKKEYRSKWFESDLREMVDRIESAGELNYILTKICSLYIKKEGLNYSCLNEVMGVIECMKQELYRRIVVPYETKKIKDNGDVYPKELVGE